MNDISLYTQNTIVRDSMYVNRKNNFDTLKDIYEKIHDVFSNIQIGKDKSIDELVKIYSNDDEFLNELKIINKSMDEIVSILNTSDSLKKELIHFLSIQRMINYMLNDIKLFLIHLSFIDDLLINFFNLVHVKLIDNNHYDEYYDKFFAYLDNQEDFFYTRIFEYNDEYEELIVEVTNILW